MKVHFIYPDIGTGYYPSFHHGLAQLFSVLEFGGHEASLHHVKKEPSKADILKRIEKEKPDFVGFTSMSNQFEYIKQWSNWIKTHYDIPVICGGVHATLNPEEVLAVSSIDAVCIGEGEQVVLDVLNIHKLGIKVKCRSSLISNLDDLPFPNYDLFECKQMLRARNGNFPVIVSRGCPFNCSYCCNHALRKQQQGLGRYFRYHSVGYTVTMLEALANMYPVKSFSFADDIFGINKEWVREFCEEYLNKVGLPFECNLRVEMATKQVLKALKSANCVKVEMGIESGSEWMRREVLNRQMSNKQIIEAFENAHELGIKTRAYNMIGLPYETAGMVWETINLNKAVEPDQVAIFYFYPYKGTKLYDVCKEKGLLSSREATGYTSESVLDLPDISARDLKILYNEFYRYMISRELRAYPFILYYLFRLVGTVLRLITRRNEVKLIKGYYMKMFLILQWLRK